MPTKKRINDFVRRWTGRGDEKQETQKFWLDLMQNVLEVPNAIHDTEFEHRTATPVTAPEGSTTRRWCPPASDSQSA